jgi:hypothetical protein
MRNKSHKQHFFKTTNKMGQKKHKKAKVGNGNNEEFMRIVLDCWAEAIRKFRSVSEESETNMFIYERLTEIRIGFSEKGNYFRVVCPNEGSAFVLQFKLKTIIEIIELSLMSAKVSGTIKDIAFDYDVQLLVPEQ